MSSANAPPPQAIFPDWLLERRRRAERTWPDGAGGHQPDAAGGRSG